MAKTKIENETETEEFGIDEAIETIESQTILTWNFPDDSISVEAESYEQALILREEILKTKTENN